MPWTFQIKNKVRFSEADVDKHAEEYRFNCGPSAICAALNLTPDELRPNLCDFEKKGYTNPTMMNNILTGLKAKWKLVYRGDGAKVMPFTDAMKLIRVQWAGPWTEPGAHHMARYRHTHWIAMQSNEIFDVNAVGAGNYDGWLPHHVWATKLVPWLIKNCEPKTANGNWWPTHVIEVERAG